jgi:hypothetical protein
VPHPTTVHARTRVLVFPCGAENGLEILDALRYSVHAEVYGASSVDDHGRLAFERYEGGLPHINDPAFLPALQALVERLGIDLLFPTHDTVCEFLAAHAGELRCAIVNGDKATAALLRRKSATYAFFADRPWAPRVFASPRDVTAWPAVVKPDQGQGGQGIAVVADEAQAVHAMAGIAEPLLVEYLPGAEVTVDCFTDRHGKLVFAGARTRERVRAGISMRSRPLPRDEAIQAIAADINASLALRGPWFFQAKRDRTGAWKLLEIACRVAGAMVAHRAQGVNIPLLALLDHKGIDVAAHADDRVALVDRRITTRADFNFDFDTVFLDYDDTLVIDGKVVPAVIGFVHAMIGRGKRVVLVTRHAHDLHASLRAVRLDASLFDAIVHLADGEPKSAHMHARAIFVDNHYPERAEVARVHGIPVFDVDAIGFFG